MGFPPPLRNRQITLKSKEKEKRERNHYIPRYDVVPYMDPRVNEFFCQIEREGQFWFAQKMNIFQRVEHLFLKTSPLTTVDLATLCN